MRWPKGSGKVLSFPVATDIASLAFDLLRDEAEACRFTYFRS